MAAQGLLFRTFNATANGRFLLNSRIIQINVQPQVVGLKHETIEKLKQLNIPEKPKRPMTAYIKFVQDHRQTLLKQNPDLKITEISKICAADWKGVHETVKQKYENEYKTQLEAYNKKFAIYTQSLTEEQKEALKLANTEEKSAKKKRAVRKKLREMNKPKRPTGAYMLYVMDQAKTTDKSYRDLLSELKDKWAGMLVKDKSKYVSLAAEDKQRYEREMRAWEEKMIREGHEDLVRTTTLAKKKPPSRLERSKKDGGK